MKYLESYKTNIPIIILVFYSLGYVYLNRFYSRFDISIENYVNLTDIIFVTIANLVRLSIFFLIVEFVLFVISQIILKLFYSKKLNPKSDSRLKDKAIYDRYYNLLIYNQSNVVSFFILLFGFFIPLLVEIDFSYLLLLLSILIIKIHQITNYKNKKEKNRMRQYLGVMMYVILIIYFAIWGHSEGNNAKTSDNSKTIEFKENNIDYNTETDSLNYIGETSSYLFIYNKNRRETLVLNKENITDFRIKDKTLTAEEKEQMAKDAEMKIDKFLNKTD